MKCTKQKKLKKPPQTDPKPFHQKRNTNKKPHIQPLIALNAKNLVIASCVTLATQI